MHTEKLLDLHAVVAVSGKDEATIRELYRASPPRFPLPRSGEVWLQSEFFAWLEEAARNPTAFGYASST